MANIENTLEEELARKRENGHKKHRCEKCDKGHRTKQEKYRHRLVCIKSISFSCATCSKEFSRRDSLARHLKMGSCRSQKRTSCEHCGRNFSSAWSLKRHVKNVHCGIKENIPTWKSAVPSMSHGALSSYSDYEDDENAEVENQNLNAVVANVLSNIDSFKLVNGKIVSSSI